MKMKSFFNDDKVCQWIINHFPANYQEMAYIELFSGMAGVLLNKLPSCEEVLHTEDETVHVLRTFRDQSSQFTRSLKKVNISQKNFEKLKNKSFSSEIDKALAEFVLRFLSQKGRKVNFSHRNKNWSKVLDTLPTISKRLEDVYITDRSTREVVKAFNEDSSLIYANLIYFADNPVDDHIQIADMLKSFKGKVVVSNRPSGLYNRLYKGWRYHLKKDKPNKVESIWVNF